MKIIKKITGVCAAALAISSVTCGLYSAGNYVYATEVTEETLSDKDADGQENVITVNDEINETKAQHESIEKSEKNEPENRSSDSDIRGADVETSNIAPVVEKKSGGVSATNDPGTPVKTTS